MNRVPVSGSAGAQHQENPSLCSTLGARLPSGYFAEVQLSPEWRQLSTLDSSCWGRMPPRPLCISECVRTFTQTQEKCCPQRRGRVFPLRKQSRHHLRRQRVPSRHGVSEYTELQPDWATLVSSKRRQRQNIASSFKGGDVVLSFLPITKSKTPKTVAVTSALSRARAREQLRTSGCVEKSCGETIFRCYKVSEERGCEPGLLKGAVG